MTGKVALVTAGSSGIGRATALAFAREGARVAIGSRHKSKAEAVVRAIRDRGGDAVWLQRAYPFPVGSAYSAAKHGVIGLTKSAALEYVSRGIRINAVCPGWVRTPPVERLIRRDPKVARQIIAQEPIGRLGTPEEIAETVIWLCSERATFVVGAALAIDGGYPA